MKPVITERFRRDITFNVLSQNPLYQPTARNDMIIFKQTPGHDLWRRFLDREEEPKHVFHVNRPCSL